MDKERQKLAAHPELAEKVRAVAWESNKCGYDVLSYTTDGRELQIEVKTTGKSEEWASGFEVTAHEAEVAKAEGDTWHLYWVTNVRRAPRHQDLGNVFTDTPSGWEESAGTWRFRKQGKSSAEA